MQEEKQDAAAIGDDEEEEDEGPPPGFQCIINPQPPQAGKVEVQVDEDDDEGPPPGFDAVVQKPASSPPLPGKKNTITFTCILRFPAFLLLYLLMFSFEQLILTLHFLVYSVTEIWFSVVLLLVKIRDLGLFC